ncbi:MAG: magnesium/cobalt transporter CorA [Alphaproteobacteria bacterium]|nr:magnesium/cobalt transporter CorA [Alphaproteobacteria bacterium]
MEHSAEDTVGLPPATAVYTGDRDHATRIRVMEFDVHQLEEREVTTPASLKGCTDTTQLSWIDVVGLSDEESISELCTLFGLHALAIEDILNTSQRAKAEEFGDHLLVSANRVELTFDDGEPVLGFEHTSIVSGPGIVLTFQERDGDAWEAVRKRIRGGMPRIRSARADFLAYALLDAIVDEYAVVVEKLGRVAEQLEARLLDDPESVSVPEIYVLRRELTELRRKAWPIRDALATWRRSEHLDDAARPFLNDLQDHATALVESIDLYRDLVMGMVDLHMSGVNNKMNETMHTLTIIATLFIPLTFLTGLYGMNFDNMPELHTRYGYYIALFTMGTTFIGGLGWFRWKGML